MPPKSIVPRSSLTAVKRRPSSCSASSSLKTASSAAASMISVRSPPSPRVPTSRTRSAVRRASARMPRSALGRAAAELAASRCPGRDRGPPPGLSYGGVADPPPARGRHASRRPAARPRRRGHRQDDRAVRALRLARARGRAGARVDPRPDRLRGGRRRAARAAREQPRRRLRGADRHHRPRLLRARCCTTRRWRPGSTRSPRRSRPPTASRCCSSASTSCRSPRTTSAATRARCSARSSAASTASRTSSSRTRTTRAWAGTLGPEADREREFAAIYAAHDRMLRGGAGRSTSATWCSTRSALLRTQPRVRARVTTRYRHVLVDELQDANFAQCLLLRLLAGEHGQISAAGDDDQAIHRLRGAAAKNLRDFEAEWPAATVVRLEESHRCPERILAAARAVAEPAPDRIAKELHGRARRRGRLLALRERARAGAGGGGRDRAARRARGRRARGHLRARALGPQRGPGGRGRARGAGGAAPARGRGGVLPARRGARPAGLAAAAGRPGDAGAVVRALARPPVELRAIDIARCTQIARRRKLDMVGALRRRARVAADPARGARAHPHVLQALPRGVERARLRAPGPLRPPPDRAARAAAPAAVRRLGGGRRAARQPRQVRRARRAPTSRRSPQATAREFARSIAAVAEAGLREEEAVAGDRPVGVQVMAMHAAKGLEFDHVYVLGLMGARMPGPRRRTLEPIPDALLKESLPARLEGGARRGDAAAAAHGDDARAAPARARLPRDDRARRGAGAVAVRGGGARGGRRRVGGQARGAVRARRDAAVDVPDPARRAAHHGLPGRRAARRAALRHRPRRLPRRRPLPRADQALRAARAHERRRGSRSPTRCPRSTRGCCRPRPPSSARSSRRARSTSTCSTPSATSGCARGPWRRAPSRRWSRSCPGAATG